MVHGVDAFDVRELEILPPLEMWVLRDHSRIRRKGCVGGERDLAPGDVMQIEGLRLTTPCRTALDLGCRLPPRQAMAALDAFTRLHNITREELKAELPRYRRRRGVVQLRQLVSLADPRLESAGESWTRLCIIDEGPPPPEPQYWVEWEGRRVRLDLAYPRHKIMIEYDGIEYHGSSAQKVHDEARRKWLRRQGWKVIVVRKDSFGFLAANAAHHTMFVTGQGGARPAGVRSLLLDQRAVRHGCGRREIRVETGRHGRG